MEEPAVAHRRRDEVGAGLTAPVGAEPAERVTGAARHRALVAVPLSALLALVTAVHSRTTRAVLAYEREYSSPSGAMVTSRSSSDDRYLDRGTNDPITNSSQCW